jgi:dihydroflavonol-4-reductase
VAEKEAWKIYREQSQWKLVVINPSLVLGPGINPHATSESFKLVKQLSDGTSKAGVPDYAIGAVDVRDVAEAHVQAALREDAEGRHITSARTTTLLELGEMLRREFGSKYPFPKRTLPKFMVWLFAPFAGVKRKMVSRNMNYPWKADNRKSIEKLGINYRPLDRAVSEMLQQMIDVGVIKQK